MQKLMDEWLGLLLMNYPSKHPMNEAIMLSQLDGRVTYLMHEFQYSYGVVSNEYWEAVFDEKLMTQELICESTAEETEEGELKQIGEKCGPDRAKRIFTEWVRRQ